MASRIAFNYISCMRAALEVHCMAMLTARNIPEEVHRALRARGSPRPGLL